MSTIRFDGRVAIVTGAGNGLGREYALLLGARGAQVLVNDYGGDTRGRGASEAPAQQVADEIVAAGGTAAACSASVADSEGGREIVAAALERWGRLDIVVNNAGIGGGVKPFEDISDRQIDAVIGTHLLGAFNVLRPAWRAMKERGYGRIVNTSSATALGVDNSIDYPAAKAGIIGMSRSLALHGAEFGIRVNAIMPLAYTRMAAQIPDPATREWMEGTFPARKVAPLIAYLCHESAKVSGEIFSVGGGRAARVMTTVIAGLKEDEPTPESIRDGWKTVMAGGDPIITIDAAADAVLMDDGFRTAVGPDSAATPDERDES